MLFGGEQAVLDGPVVGAERRGDVAAGLRHEILHEARRAGIEPEHVVHHQHLAVALRGGARNHLLVQLPSRKQLKY